jgi:hypothetical protein
MKNRVGVESVVLFIPYHQPLFALRLIFFWSLYLSESQQEAGDKHEKRLDCSG